MTARRTPLPIEWHPPTECEIQRQRAFVLDSFYHFRRHLEGEVKTQEGTDKARHLDRVAMGLAQAAATMSVGRRLRVTGVD